MSETPSPVPSALPATGRFAKAAAAYSIIAPLIALLGAAVFMYPRAQALAPLAWGIAFSLIFSGLVFGSVALLMNRQPRRKGVFVTALVGTCVNALLVLIVPAAILVFFFFSRGVSMTIPGTYDQAVKELAGATNREMRFYALDAAAKQSFEAGKIDDARKYATELLTLAPGFKGDWNYGNAIQDGNLVLGRIAVKEGRVAEAKQYLVEAGKSPGSPQMNSFGPNMSLAKDLLEKGERDAALQYFELCRKFWKMDNGQLNQWSQEVKAGKAPDFGANLLY